MGKIDSNLFDLDLDLLIDKNSDEICNAMDNKVNIEKVYENYSETLNSKSKIMRSKVIVDDIVFKTFDITKENFSEKQYDILKHHNIALSIDDNNYSFLTPDGTIYKISDTNLINIVMNTPRPRKIVYDSVCSTSSVYSMQLLANIIECIKTNTIAELLSAYNYEYKDDYNALNILLCIYPIYEKLIYKYQYNSYINYEHKIYNIFKSISYRLDPQMYKNRIEVCNKEIDSLCTKLQIDTISEYKPLDFLSNITNLKNNNLIYPSLNSELLNSIKLNDYSKLVEYLSEKNFIESVNNNILEYDTYFNAGVKTFYPSISNCNNKLYIRGSYQHLYQNIIAELLKNPEYIDIINNNNNNILTEILISKDINYKDNTIILLEWALLASINGCKTIEDYKLYFYSQKHTILCDDDITYIVSILNNDLHQILDLIDTASSAIYNDNLILHGDFTSFNKLLLGVQRKLSKDLIIEVSDYIIDFNNKNKAKIYFIGYFEDTIYLECEEGSLTVAIDTLTRTLVRVYDKYLRRTKAHCLVEKLNI